MLLFFFLTATWLFHGHFWAIAEGAASLTTAYRYFFDPLNAFGYLIGRNCRGKKKWQILFLLKVVLKDARTECRELLNFQMLRIAKLLKVAGINCREPKKSKKVALHDLDLKKSCK